MNNLMARYDDNDSYKSDPVNILEIIVGYGRSSACGGVVRDRLPNRVKRGGFGARSCPDGKKINSVNNNNIE